MRLTPDHLSSARALRMFRLLHELRHGEPVRRDDLARDLDVTRSQLDGDLDVLRRLGCLIEAEDGWLRMVDDHLAASGSGPAGVYAECGALAPLLGRAARRALQSLGDLAALHNGARRAA